MKRLGIICALFASPLYAQGAGPVSRVTVQNFPTSQAVSGTIAATQSGAWTVGISGTPTFNCGTGCYQATQPVSGTVAVSNFPASQAVTGTFWQVTQPVSIAATLTIQDANGGSLNTAETATSDSTAALNPVTAVNATAVLVATGARNFYSASISAGSTSGYMIVGNFASVPASGTALTANGNMLKCVPAVANLLNSFEPRVPYRASAGVVILFSQSCATYTPVSPVAVAIDGRAL